MISSVLTSGVACAMIHRDLYQNSRINLKTSEEQNTGSASKKFITKMANVDAGNEKLQNVSRSDISKIEKEGELIGMLSKQLYLAGNQMQRMQTVMKKAEDRLKTKDQEIGRLKRKVREWEVKSRNQETIHKKELQKRQSQVDNADYIYKKCIKLEHKIFEMEKFLADYGLVWVGETKNKSSSKHSNDLSNDTMENCYSQLISNIEELNLSVGKGEMHVCHNQGGAIFKSPSCMTLKFYKNGMILKKGRLRSYKDPHTKSFIQDILDGYFPSELQRNYPNGVPFKVEDHRMEMYLGDGANYPGTGYQLGKQSLSQIRISKSSSRVKGSSTARSSLDAKQTWNSPNNTPRPSFSTQSDNLVSSFDPPITTSGIRLPDLNLFDLRNQILASHNNNCSDSHLQSHINAELSMSGKAEKKSTVLNQDAESSLSSRELNRGSMEKVSIASPKPIKTCRVSSIDSSTFNIQPSRQSGMRNNRLRSRSVSLSGKCIQPRSFSRLNTVDASNITSKNFKAIKCKTGKLRATKSATLDKNKCEIPILREINSSTGRSGELRLKVRSMNGSTVYLVHISADDTVARLYQLLDTVVRPKKHSTVGYKILISGYAPKRLDHMGFFLRDYGILRDCVLHLVND